MRIGKFFTRNVITYVLEFIKYYVLYPFAVWKYRGHNIYVVAERGTDARDNGYHLYRYIRQTYPELEAYYIIAKDSPDRKKVELYGNVVAWGSLKHYLLFIAAQYKISTHIAGYSPNINFYTKFVGKLHWRGKRIFLQHGVIKDDLKGLYWEKTLVDLFICGAKPEYDDVSARYHYADGQVRYTGLARYDALHDIELKQQVLVMPTWRVFLKEKNQEDVLASDYVTKWNRVLNDERLLQKLNIAGMQLVFYPHYEAQKFLSLFQSKDPAVVIADFAHFDVQQLLKESKLLVTDFSSVFFDFAYMKKPCIYYQFDEEEFFGKHYEKGYFDYDEMGFGEVVREHELLVEHIIQYIENNFAMEKKYEQRIEGFFALHDRNNCERIFAEIQSL